MTTSLRRSGARARVHSLSRPAGLVLGGLALAAGLAACGNDGGDGDTANDPDTSQTPSDSEAPTETPTETPTAPESAGSGQPQTIPATGSAGVTEALMVHATEAGGESSTFAFALDTDQAVADFVAGLDAGLPELVDEAVAEVSRPGSTPYGTIAAVGCEGPRSVAVEAGEAGFEVVPKLPKSTVQCLAPMTYVVVFAAPDA
jgi:hypothetical protein